MRRLGPPMECPNCHQTIYLATTGPILELQYRGAWKVDQSGRLTRVGKGEGNLALHKCPELA